MDADLENDVSASIEGVNVNEVEAEINTIDSLRVLSSNGDIGQEIESAGEILTKLELELVCSSEKLVNLDVLVMHVATRESDFEAFASEKGHISNDIVKKAIEFDLLSGVLDSEVRELDDFLSSVTKESDNVHKIISSRQHAEEALVLMEEKFHDCENSLKLCQDHILELGVQCTNFQRIVLFAEGDQNCQDGEALEHFDSDALLTPSTKIKMQTVEQQRDILRMLEKSLARELDLEKKLTVSRQIEEDLKLRLQQEAFCIEEEIEVAWERLFEGDNAAEVLLGISKELMSRLQMAHFNLNGTVQRENNLLSKLQDFEKHLNTKDILLQKSEIICKDLGDKVKSLEKRLENSEFQLHNYTVSAKKNEELESEIHEMENTINILKEKNSEVERRVETAEAECKSVKEANVELKKEVSLLKSSSSVTLERIDILEKKLRHTELHLQHAVASAEASQEKQIMLNSTIDDMGNLIEDLKLKVSKAESLTESAEEKCIILSESNAELNDELTFVKERLACLEVSLHKAKETKKATTREINFRSNLIKDLIVQLAFERERLEKQISFLKKENMKNYQQKDKIPSLISLSDDIVTKEPVLPKAESSAATFPNECKEEGTQFSSPTNVDENVAKDFSTNKQGHSPARQLKYFFIALLMFLISAAAAVLLGHWSSQF